MKNALQFTRLVSLVALTATFVILAGSDDAMSLEVSRQTTITATNRLVVAFDALTLNDRPVQFVSAEPPAAGGKTEPVDPKLYGSTSGEKTVSPDSASKITPLRSRSGDTLFKLSNPRNEVVKETPGKFGKGKAPNPNGTPVISVDYEIAAEKAIIGDLSLILRTADGQDATVSISKLEKRAGTISLKVADAPWRKGPGAPPAASGSLPQNFEMYLVRTENRYGKESIRTFKVSNSIIMGETRFPITLARDWTPSEGSIFAIPPVEPPKPGLNKGVGEDTPFAGKAVPSGQGFWRYVDPTKPLIGLDLQTGFFFIKGGKEDCLSNAVPIYDRKYPDMGLTRVLAKPGYAIGGITVKTNNFVNAFQITFMKLKDDNSSLDTKDTYTSEWLGPKQVGINEVKLGGDGRKVIGIFLNKGAVLDGFALVMDAKR